MGYIKRSFDDTEVRNFAKIFIKEVFNILFEFFFTGHYTTYKNSYLYFFKN